MDTVKAALKAKSVGVNGNSKKEERSQINDLTLHLK